ncbi:hypothetical protein FD755_024002 [Muntiacus reevesi]|uniref:Potassium channel domain-containing protein n=1 Tax=Muntiacus reevesi TaxID=9886 RepID=A0A5N3VVC2_MUNRE|nr:hypothetical protein FD755_024002 [Muntiacus reevesi]
MLQSLAGSSCVRLVERHRSAWCFGFLVLGYLLYLVFGAVVFSSVELPYEDQLRQDLRKLKRRFLDEHECLSEPQLEKFLGRVLEASNYGVSVLSNASGNWNWDFTSALFFASTVLSTTAREQAKWGHPDSAVLGFFFPPTFRFCFLCLSWLCSPELRVPFLGICAKLGIIFSSAKASGFTELQKISNWVTVLHLEQTIIPQIPFCPFLQLQKSTVLVKKKKKDEERCLIIGIQIAL